jgi:hypothetical protein
VRALAKTKLLANPGEEYHYFNWAFAVAGAMMEGITGKSYETLIRTFVFELLGMESAGFGQRPDAMTPRSLGPIRTTEFQCRLTILLVTFKLEVIFDRLNVSCNINYAARLNTSIFIADAAFLFSFHPNIIFP